MKLMGDEKGLTLIEIIIAMAILGIILVSFLNVFVSGYTTIFNMGDKTQAMAQAQEIIDNVYVNGTDPSATEVIPTELYNQTGNTARYSFDTVNVLGDNYDIVTVVVFYKNWNEYVSLSTIIP